MVTTNSQLVSLPKDACINQNKIIVSYGQYAIIKYSLKKRDMTIFTSRKIETTAPEHFVDPFGCIII